MAVELALEKMLDSTKLLDSGQFADCHLKCGKRTWDLHKAVLCSRSRYFEAAFTGNFQVGRRNWRTTILKERQLAVLSQEATTGQIVLEEMNADIVGLVIRSLYSGNTDHISRFEKIQAGVSGPYEIYACIYQAADYLGVDVLCHICVRELEALNKKLAPQIQDEYIEAKGCISGVKLLEMSPGSLAATFLLGADIAYSLPTPMLGKPGIPDSNPRGLQRPFLQFFHFSRFLPLKNGEFMSALTGIPALMADVSRLMAGDDPSPPTIFDVCDNCRRVV